MTLSCLKISAQGLGNYFFFFILISRDVHKILKRVRRPNIIFFSLPPLRISKCRGIFWGLKGEGVCEKESQHILLEGKAFLNI